MKMMVKDHYLVRFDRNHESVEFWADGSSDLAEQIFHYVKTADPSLAYLEFTVEVDLIKREGSINKGQYAMFKIDRLDP